MAWIYVEGGHAPALAVLACRASPNGARQRLTRPMGLCGSTAADEPERAKQAGQGRKNSVGVGIATATTAPAAGAENDATGANGAAGDAYERTPPPDEFDVHEAEMQKDQEKRDELDKVWMKQALEGGGASKYLEPENLARQLEEHSSSSDEEDDGGGGAGDGDGGGGAVAAAGGDA